MRTASVIVLSSFALSLGVITSALWSTPGMRHAFAGYGIKEWFITSVALVAMTAICGWPWAAAYFKSLSRQGAPSAIVFSAASAGLALLFFKSISSALAEGVGYNLLFFVFLAWLIFPLSLLAKGEEE